MKTLHVIVVARANYWAVPKMWTSKCYFHGLRKRCWSSFVTSSGVERQTAVCRHFADDYARCVRLFDGTSSLYYLFTLSRPLCELTTRNSVYNANALSRFPPRNWIMVLKGFTAVCNLQINQQCYVENILPLYDENLTHFSSKCLYIMFFFYPVIISFIVCSMLTDKVACTGSRFCACLRELVYAR